MNPHRRRFSLGALALAVLLAASCAGDRDDEERQASGEEAPAAPLRTVLLSAQQEAAAGIQTVALQGQRRAGEVKAWGRVLSVQELASARESLASAASAAAAARAQAEAAGKEAERAQLLFAQNATLSQKNLEAARAAAEGARAASAAAEAALASQRATAAQAWGAGLAADLERGSGPVADLFARRRVPVLVTAGPGPAAAPGTATVLAGGHPLEARLLGSVPRTDGVLQGPGWLYAAGPGAEDLAAGMNLEVLLPGGPARAGVSVPQEAGVWWRGTLWAYRREAQGRYVRLPLGDPEPAPGGWFVAGGLAPGDLLVVRGAQLLFSEEMKGLTPATEE